MTAPVTMAGEVPSLLAELAAVRRHVEGLEAAVIAGAAGRSPVPGLPTTDWVNRLAGVVAEEFGIGLRELVGGGPRHPSFIRARWTWVSVVRAVSGYPYPRIARLTGYADHTTLIYACRKVEGWRTGDAAYRAVWEQLAAIARHLRGERLAAVEVDAAPAGEVAP